MLQGRSAIITGASRGIGRAIALGLARQGCAVVIAARSTQPREKLPGSIYTVAAEVEALGGQALPVAVDVRDETQIEATVAQALERFGRIDLLVNNAGALHWQGLLDTPAKRFDLELARSGCCLLVGERQVKGDVLGEGKGEVRERDNGLSLLGQFEERLAEGKLVGCDVAAEQDDGTPVIIKRRVDFGELHGMAPCRGRTSPLEQTGVASSRPVAAPLSSSLVTPRSQARRSLPW
jgi:NAD(P)-dependent dehydrogenase (short-subunit alcohol dehydrogenase family)